MAHPTLFLMRTLLRFFFYLLYHPFAFTYDIVAATVSLGRWKDWVLSVVPFIEGNQILEIGHGPGHLQRLLLSRHLLVVGIDESAPMGRLAKHNLRRFFSQIQPKTSSPSKTNLNPQSDYTQISLTRGVAQHLPFPNKSFDTVVATFPTEYIFESETLNEAQRVLISGGRLVILPSATILGRGILDRLMALIFHITGQSSPSLSELLEEKTKAPFGESGFYVQIHELDIKSSLVFIIVATKLSH
jgi:ubiquinone/menaquinone biosynthesis C-methylase UbiE